MLVFLLIGSISNVGLVKAAEVFNDLGNVQWAKDEIYYLNERNIVNGTGNGKFSPNVNIKREQAAIMLVRALYPNEVSSTKLKFPDVKPGNFYYNAIAVAVDHGLINGFDDGTFRPTEPITRAQTAKILALAYNLKGTNANFTDLNQAPWAIDYIQALASNNIVNGYKDNTFKPNNQITRAEFSVSLARCLDDKFKPIVKNLKAHFINVGQGDSIFIQTPNGKNILVDGGPRSAGNDVVSYLKQQGVTGIDLMVATHPDADHIGGLINVLQDLTVKKVLDSGATHTTQTFADYLTLIDQKNIPFVVPKEGDLISLDSDLKIQVLNSYDAGEESNEGSIVLKISFKDIDFLLMGDADSQVEQTLVNKYNLEAEVLKVGHHGSNTSSSLPFLQEVQPNVSVLSYGIDNSYGHPYQEVINRLKSVGSNIYSTALSGTIVVTSNGTNLGVNTTPAAYPEEPLQPVDSKISITGVDLVGEIVTITNGESASVDLSGWYIISVEGNQRYNFPQGTIINPGAIIKVVSGANAVAGPNQLVWSKAYIWNNSGDLAQLYNAKGELISEYR